MSIESDAGHEHDLLGPGALVDLGELELSDLALVSSPVLRRSLTRLIEEAGRPGETCAGFDSAI